MKPLRLSYVILIVLAQGALLAVCAQDQKSISWPDVFRNNPMHMRSDSPNHRLVNQLEQIEIEDIQVEGQSIILGQPFTASLEWLGNIRFRIKNTSGQRLEFVQITLVLPEIDSGGPQLPFICSECRVDKKQVSIEPDAEVYLTMPQPIYSWAKGVIAEKASLVRISKAQILTAIAKAPDDISWSSDCVRTSDRRNACSPTRP